MEPSESALKLIRKYEGLKLKAYLCPSGIPTIGYGTTMYPDGQKVGLGQTCTVGQAEAWLVHAVERCASSISAMVHVNLTQGQMDAMVSFTYNVGINSLRNSTLLRLLNAADYDGAAAQFDRWVYGTQHGQKVKLPGLITRRHEERAMFEGAQP